MRSSSACVSRWVRGVALLINGGARQREIGQVEDACRAPWKLGPERSPFDGLRRASKEAAYEWRRYRNAIEPREITSGNIIGYSGILFLRGPTPRLTRSRRRPLARNLQWPRHCRRTRGRGDSAAVWLHTQGIARPLRCVAKLGIQFEPERVYRSASIGRSIDRIFRSRRGDLERDQMRSIRSSLRFSPATLAMCFIASFSSASSSIQPWRELYQPGGNA